MSDSKKYIRVVKGPIQIGTDVIGTKGYAHVSADEADALEVVGYAKVVGDQEGAAGVKPQVVTTKPDEPTKPEEPAKKAK